MNVKRNIFLFLGIGCILLLLIGCSNISNKTITSNNITGTRDNITGNSYAKVTGIKLSLYKTDENNLIDDLITPDVDNIYTVDKNSDYILAVRLIFGGGSALPAIYKENLSFDYDSSLISIIDDIYMFTNFNEYHLKIDAEDFSTTIVAKYNECSDSLVLNSN